MFWFRSDTIPLLILSFPTLIPPTADRTVKIAWLSILDGFQKEGTQEINKTTKIIITVWILQYSFICAL